MSLPQLMQIDNQQHVMLGLVLSAMYVLEKESALCDRDGNERGDEEERRCSGVERMTTIN